MRIPHPCKVFFPRALQHSVNSSSSRDELCNRKTGIRLRICTPIYCNVAFGDRMFFKTYIDNGSITDAIIRRKMVQLLQHVHDNNNQLMKNFFKKKKKKLPTIGSSIGCQHSDCAALSNYSS